MASLVGNGIYCCAKAILNEHKKKQNGKIIYFKKTINGNKNLKVQKINYLHKNFSFMRTFISRLFLEA